MDEAIFSQNPQTGPNVSRRDFVKAAGATLIVGGLPVGTPRSSEASASTPASADGVVARFFRSLKDDQRKHLCFPADHPLRGRVENNWAIVRPTIGDLAMEQQALCREVFQTLCSDEGYDRFRRQMNDDYGGFENYHVALFGEPGTDLPFEWVLTGRHATLRAGGNRGDVAAFSGPIFFGHAADGRFHEDPKHTNNVWWYQAEQANRIFATLDDLERSRALVAEGADDDDARSVHLKGRELGEAGLAVADLDASQKTMVTQLLKDLVRPFRAGAAEQIQECLREAGGADLLRLTFYKEGDVGDDQVWDLWKLEGPAFAWYFHGSPHVHSWVNLARRAEG